MIKLTPVNFITSFRIYKKIYDLNLKVHRVTSATRGLSDQNNSKRPVGTSWSSLESWELPSAWCDSGANQVHRLGNL